MAAIVEASEDPIIGKDLNGTVFAWNGAAERLFGYTAEEMIGKPVTIIFPPDRVQEEEHILARIARGEKVEQYETSRRHKDGRLIRIAATVSPIRDERGSIIGASKIVRDLTQLDAQEERIQQLQTELAHVQRLTELGQVVSALVHEVNQPITAIKNYLGACRRLAASGNQTALQSVLEKIERETNRTSEVIQGYAIL